MRLFLISMTIATLLVGCNGQSSKSKLRDQDKQKEDIKLTDEQLLDSVQKQTFNYFWEGAEPTSGLARERIHLDDIYPTHDKDIITIGGSGFGVMAILVGIEREFITREMGLERLEKAVDFLDNADRFHGAWPHWLTPDGKMTPFSKKDNGGDLVETAFLIEGLLTVKEYFKDGNDREQALAQRVQILWEEVEWDWYTKGENVLYWHWSQNMSGI